MNKSVCIWILHGGWCTLTCCGKEIKTGSGAFGECPYCKREISVYKAIKKKRAIEKEIERNEGVTL